MAPPDEARVLSELRAAGRPATGPLVQLKAWWRCILHTVETAKGTVWVKHSDRLPPGEEVVLGVLHDRSPLGFPTVVATWPGEMATDELDGVELTPTCTAGPG